MVNTTYNIILKLANININVCDWNHEETEEWGSLRICGEANRGKSSNNQTH
uniref:Uncharacterized protein n=1 Tax=Arion vulgaris TaxID=1028688 RepID=A0A0B6ZX52_9EUPU